MIATFSPTRLLFFLLPWAFPFPFSPSFPDLSSTPSVSHTSPILAHAFPIRDGLLFRLSQVRSQTSERGIFFSWWGLDSSVSIVDRSPPITFTARPASFGHDLEEPLLGYVIPLDAFTVPCEKDDPDPDSSSSWMLVDSVDDVVEDYSGSGTPAEGLVNDKPTDTPDNLGCPKVCVTGPHEPGSNDPWIALVQRGGCQFVDKAREAQRLGAKAIVVGGDNPDIYGNPDTLVNMYSPEDASDVKISATFIRYSDYIELYSLIGASNTSHNGLRTLSLLLSTETSAWEWYSPIVTFIVILLLPSFLTLITLLVHRVRASRAAQRDRAPEDIVKNLPWRVWNGTKWEKANRTSRTNTPPKAGDATDPAPNNNLTVNASNEGDDELDTVEQGSSRIHLPWYTTQAECAICLEEFVVGDKVRVLPCEHVFHMNEIDDWLINRKKLCPVCKMDVTRDHPDYQPSPVNEVSSNSSLDLDEGASGIPSPPGETTPLLRPSNASVASRNSR
ncbi:hypothetical protein BDM02DRAFT_3264018 [Thelephora ganbajun]|uniref:Uncharacterized protein n=1 Tax=Thelephora ganbajun TaxID=370292 RepID=A0ACB6Z2I9_THEGA|nr:hypothetical protein BDM02DRAFT_3264018 [Thelephora ganbajun]